MKYLATVVDVFGGRVVMVSLNQAGRQNKLKSKSKTNMLFQHIICVCVSNKKLQLGAANHFNM